MKDLRIVFMGTPDFAVSILKSLVTAKFTIAGVITAPDKPAGRGRKINQSAVKKYALENDLKILQPTNLKSPEFIEELKSLNANLQIVVAFRMLPKEVWQLPELGTFNLHASLLPDYRGAAPINWALINGESKTGVTTFFIDDKIDTGEIILQRETNIKPNEIVGELHDKLMHLGSQLVLETVELIQKDEVSTTKQPEKVAKSAYKIHTSTCKIDWHNNLDTIYNHIRGLNPYPAAWTTLYNGSTETKVKIFDIEKEHTSHKNEIGAIISDKKTLKVAVKDGFLKINSLQLSGKKRMDTVSLLNGYKFENASKMA